LSRLRPITIWAIMKRIKKATKEIADANFPDLAAQDSMKNITGEMTLMDQKLAVRAVASYSMPLVMTEQTMHMARANCAKLLIALTALKLPLVLEKTMLPMRV